MPDEFQYDAFLSHSSKDKVAARQMVERLRAEGVKANAEFLHSSFCLLPFQSAPLNKERRFLPLRLDGALTRCGRLD